MLMPVWLERFQIKYVNPLLRPLSKRMPGFAVIKHRGRTSGKDYETIVTAYRNGSVLAIGLIHGKTNWVKNVLAAGEADIHVGRKDLHLVNPGCCRWARSTPRFRESPGCSRSVRAPSSRMSRKTRLS
jgi:deazaflavin-dependent oxidoreductase (nitroreductase family)